MGTKHIWVCEDCLSENLEKRPNTDKPEEWVSWGVWGVENYCLDCESFTIKINRGMINDAKIGRDVWGVG